MRRVAVHCLLVTRNAHFRVLTVTFNDSPYGMLTWVTDFNKQHYLQRTNKVCDFAMTEPFAKCHEMSYCFSNYTTLYEFDMCLESNVHGNLHSMHAGLFDCEVSWQDWYEEVSRKGAGNAMVLARRFPLCRPPPSASFACCR